MKIAVLFGSFNPLTNAHIAAMKTAVAQLQADKGLFVATNGNYLRRKTVKINDPFYLTEEERRQTIEQACAHEPNLSFWGFELGSYNPSRYKTLCKIQKEYPDAQLYEIQGADKVHTILRSKYAEDHLHLFKIAVFRRFDIDLDHLFDSEPLLLRYRDSFVLLPALDGTAQISSTMVRHNFYEGKDFSAFVPASTVQVLSKHQPSDFSIPFAEQMKTIINSGRYGMRQAGKKIYQLNRDLFYQWQAGKNAIDFGDYRSYLDQTRFYKKPFSVDHLGTHYPETQTGCINCDCVDLAQYLKEQGYNPAILNLASARSPGGGYHDGYAAQEESLCHSSNLNLSLYQFGDPKRWHIKESGVPVKEDRYPLDTNFGGVYTPNVTFFRHGRTKFFTLRENPFTCDVITVAALSFTGRTVFCGVNELSYRADDGGFTPAGDAIMRNKIRTIFRLGVQHGKDALVLGAFGCGAFKLPVPDVVALFRDIMNEPEFAGKFRLVTFAILESTRKPNGLEGKFAPFYQEFGTYTMD